MKQDSGNEIGVLRRREIEARIVGPLLRELARQLGEERVYAIAREVIANLAREQGAALACAAGGSTLEHFAASMGAWTKDDALSIEVLEQSEEALSFDVKRCRFAEMYRELGMPELGELLSCQRDGALVEGFNPKVRLKRTLTILGGGDRCDFRFRANGADGDEA